MGNHYQDFYFTDSQDKREKSDEIKNKLQEITELLLSYSLQELNKITAKNLQQIYELENISMFTANFSTPEASRIKYLLLYDQAQYGDSPKLSNNLRACEEFKSYHWKEYMELVREISELIDSYTGQK